MAVFSVNIIMPDGSIHTESVTADGYEKSIDGELTLYRSADRVKVATFRQYSFILYSDPKDADSAPALPDKTQDTSSGTVK